MSTSSQLSSRKLHDLWTKCSMQTNYSDQSQHLQSDLESSTSFNLLLLWSRNKGKVWMLKNRGDR